MNFIPCRLVGKGTEIMAEVQDAFGRVQYLPVPNPRALASMSGKDVILGLRPEKITEPLQHKEQEPLISHLQLKVLVTEPTGADTMLVSELNGEQVDCRVGPRFGVKPGEITDLMLDMSLAVFFDPQTGARLDRA
ncbi:hypothetical protein OUO13_07645 [Oceanospirillaceae bacterium G-43]|uniref:MalK-like OB fold domain-containing protein n=2 Tax=Parathalassolituus penaei TaxID=2997323 RepID=A0A9X3EIX1_9GAMM|nr:hypothetical protein [Parathalassolituus penaei]